jgi:putative membrane protein
VPSKAPPAPLDSVNTINGADREFILQAEDSNIQERVLGRMAEEKSQNGGVRKYGKMVAVDHNNALQKLVVIMEKNGIAEPGTLPEERKDAVDKLQGLSGEAFDREFVNLMVQDHQKSINAFREEVETAQNADVRNYAKNMLPTLERHLKDAQDLQKGMSAKQ